jgi:hypothetical protein
MIRKAIWAHSDAGQVNTMENADRTKIVYRERLRVRRHRALEALANHLAKLPAAEFDLIRGFSYLSGIQWSGGRMRLPAKVFHCGVARAGLFNELNMAIIRWMCAACQHGALQSDGPRGARALRSRRPPVVHPTTGTL